MTRAYVGVLGRDVVCRVGLEETARLHAMPSLCECEAPCCQQGVYVMVLISLQAIHVQVGPFTQQLSKKTMYLFLLC